MQRALAAVIELLTGRDRPDLLAALGGLRRDALTAAADRFWADLAVSDPGCIGLSSRWAELSEGVRARLLGAPALWSWSLEVGRRPPADLAWALEDWMAAETATDGDPVRRWTALGDRCVGGGVDAYRAPVLRGGTPVDTASPQALNDLPEIAGRAGPFRFDEARLALDRLLAAEAALDSLPLPWGRLVRSHTKVIVCRNDPSSPSFSSASTRLAFGRPVLRNPHALGVTAAVILDGWVHEAVHGVLDTLELSEAFVQPEAAECVASVVSPWTGNLLDLDTYVHATFVWFALWHLWLDASRAGAFDADTRTRMLLRPARGFAYDNVVDRLGDNADGLSHGVEDAMRAAHAIVGSALKEDPL